MTWEDSYAIAHALMAAYPAADISEISLLTLYHWTLDLPDFDDDPALANEAILNAIVQEWLEANPL